MPGKGSAPTVKQATASVSISSSAFATSSAKASSTTRTLASLSPTMYAICDPTKWWLMGVR